MINLLPPSEKQNLLMQSRWKTAMILSLLIFIFIISVILVLTSINISLATNVKVQNFILDGKKRDGGVLEIQSIKKEIAQVNKDLIQINAFYKQKSSMSVFLEKIANLLPEGIYLNNIYITPAGKEENNFQVNLSGHAKSVEDTIELNERMKRDEKFSQINFPPETWFEKNDFNFNVSFRAIIAK